MRPPSCGKLLRTAAAAAMLVPLGSAASQVQARLGTPRIVFSESGASLSRNVFVALDGPTMALELRTPQCVQLAGSSSQGDGYGGTTCTENTQWNATHDLTATFKVPQWASSAPYVDLSLRSWKERQRGDDTRGAASGSAVDVEVTHALGPYQLMTGYSQPLSSSNSGAWRSTWAGASVRLAPGTRLRLSMEASQETRTGIRDTRFSLQLARTMGDAMRLNASVTRARDDPARRWRAGVGLDWAF